jgi:hypothetical protein
MPRRCISGTPRYRPRDPDGSPFLRAHPAGPRSPVCLRGRHRCLLVSIARPAIVQIAATLATLLPALLFVRIALCSRAPKSCHGGRHPAPLSNLGNQPGSPTLAQTNGDGELPSRPSPTTRPGLLPCSREGGGRNKAGPEVHIFRGARSAYFLYIFGGPKAHLGGHVPCPGLSAGAWPAAGVQRPLEGEAQLACVFLSRTGRPSARPQSPWFFLFAPRPPSVPTRARA